MGKQWQARCVDCGAGTPDYVDFAPTSRMTRYFDLGAGWIRWYKGDQKKEKLQGHAARELAG